MQVKNSFFSLTGNQFVETRKSATSTIVSSHPSENPDHSRPFSPADPSQPSISGITSTPKTSKLPCTKISEHRRLFGYAAKGKGQSKKGKAVTKRSVPTCALKFVCLATRDPIKPPSSVKERTALANAGLGDATITFDLDGDSMHLHQLIVEKFPKLNTTGYQMMLYDRSGENSSFCNLNPPYLPRKLKEVSGQCKIYVKPLQQDLIDSDDEECIQVSLKTM